MRKSIVLHSFFAEGSGAKRRSIQQARANLTRLQEPV
jgi:hypothetical protein